MKNIWKISGISIAFGLVLMLVGFLLGANRHIYADSSGFHLVDNKNEAHSIIEHNMNSFKDIDINSDYSDIELIKSNNYGIEINYGSDVLPTWSLENGKLSIDYKNIASSQNYFRFFNLDLSFINSVKNVIKIYYPESAFLNDCSIKSSSGTINIDSLSVQNLNIINDYGDFSISNSKINGLDLTMSSGDLKLESTSIQNVNIKNSYGDISIDNSNINGLDLTMSSGDLILNSCQIQSADVKNSYGNINGDSITSSKINVTSSSGNVVLNGNLSGNTQIQSDYGDVTLNLSKSEDAYAYDISTKFGNVIFDGTKESDSSIKKTDASSSNNLNISAQSGNIRVNFKK